MDNISNSNTSPEQFLKTSKLPVTVLLNSDQYESYKTFALEILAPDGKLLEKIGRNIQESSLETDELQLHNQVVLLEYLCNSINQDTELPAQAIFGLTDVFCKMRHYLEKRAQ